MRLTGTLLDIEPYAGDFKGDDGSTIPYAGERLHVLDGREVVKVKVPKAMLGQHGLSVGEAVDLRVQVSAQSGQRGVYLSVGLLGRYVPVDSLSAGSAALAVVRENSKKEA